MPSGEVITRLPVPEPATAQNKLSDGDQAMEDQPLSAALVLDVHVMPSGEVITRLPVPEPATAQNKLSDGDHASEVQLLSAALALAFQNRPASPESL
jgi:hypothetical protein